MHAERAPTHSSEPVPSSDSQARPITLVAAPKISIVITNFNYAKYVAQAIDSALDQSPPVHEVIVVDDASTDHSRDIIERYRGRVKIILQPRNSGQAAGFNAGYAAATGDLIGFLDADDFLLPGLIERAQSVFSPDVALYNFRMRYANEAGKMQGSFPAKEMALHSGSLSKLVRTRGSYVGSVTSGMLFARFALEQVMPVPEDVFRINADGYLFVTAPLLGQITGSDVFHAAYRIHAAQFTTAAQPLGARARKRLAHDAARYEVIRDLSGQLGLPVVDDMGDHDPFNLFERLVSLTFEPEHHPVAGDSVGKLAARLRQLDQPILVGGLRHAGWRSRIVLTVLQMMPNGLRRALLREMITSRLIARIKSSLPH
jgi:hypothetical protein